ncbi:hypothetical protein BH10PLA2_BH10PLA2_29580 [soil metagenome]
MATRRSKVMIGLAVLSLALLIGGFVFNSGYARHSEVVYESLREEMTVQEVSTLMKRDVSTDMVSVYSMNGDESRDCWLEAEWWVVPQSEIHLTFVEGGLKYKSRREMSLSETWTGLVQRGKKFLGW